MSKDAIIGILIIGAASIIIVWVGYLHISNVNACSEAGGVLIKDKCLDIKQIPIITK